MSFNAAEYPLLFTMLGLWVLGIIAAVVMAGRVLTAKAISLTLVALFAPLVGSIIVVGFWRVDAARRRLPLAPSRV